MTNFMLTTAIVAVTSSGAFAQITDTNQTQQQPAQQQAQMVPAFLVSDFTSKNLYTLTVEEARHLRDQRQVPRDEEAAQDDLTMWERVRLQWESTATFTAHRENWENVGNIDDVVMTAEGEIRGVLIDVGGFLGLGARTVMVDVENLYFVSDHEGANGWFTDTASDFFVVAAMTEEELEALPVWDEEVLHSGFERRSYDDRRHEPGGTMGHDTDVAEREGRDAAAVQESAAAAAEEEERTEMAARTETPGGYELMAPEQQTAGALMGADVFGIEDRPIGAVEDLIMGSETEITHLVLDIGGFLGVGTKRIALPVEDADIFWSMQDNEVRIQVPMSQDELERLPEFEG